MPGTPRWPSALLPIALIAMAAAGGPPPAATERAPPEPPAAPPPAPSAPAPAEPPLPKGAVRRMAGISFRHGGEVLALAFSPDGRQFASAGGGEIRFWNLDGTKDRGADLPIKEARCGAFSPGAATLALGEREKGVLLLEAGTGKTLRRLDTGAEPILSLAFSPDGKSLASASRGGAVCVWRLETGAALRTFPGTESVQAVAFSPDGATVFWGDDRGDIYRARWAEPGPPKRLANYPKAILSLAFSPDGKTLAAGFVGKAIRFFDTTTGVKTFVQTEMESAAMALAYSADGRRLLAGNLEGGLFLWRADASKDIPAALERADIRTLHALAFSPDGSILAAGTESRTIPIWDVATGKLLRRLGGPDDASGVLCLRFSPDGKTLAAGTNDRSVDLWDLSTGRKTKSFPMLNNPADRLAFSRDGRTLAACNRTKEVLLGDVNSAMTKRIHLLRLSTIYSAAFSPDGSALGVATPDGEISHFPLESFEKQVLLGRHEGIVHDLTFSSNGSMLASISRNGDLKVWDVAAWQEVIRRSLRMEFEAAVFSPDGSWAACAASNRMLYALDWRHEFRPREIGKIPDPIRALAVSPTGLIAAGTEAREILLWDATPRPEPWKAEPAREILRKELERRWEDLSGMDPDAAETVSREFLAGGKSAFEFLRDRMEPAPGDDEEIRRTRVRDDTLPPSRLPGPTLRRVRAVRVFERIGTPEAADVLAVIARRSRSAAVAVAAAEALARLRAREASRKAP